MQESRTFNREEKKAEQENENEIQMQFNFNEDEESEESESLQDEYSYSVWTRRQQDEAGSMAAAAAVRFAARREPLRQRESEVEEADNAVDSDSALWAFEDTSSIVSGDLNKE